MQDEIKKLTNRHIAKLLDKLDEVGTPQMTKDAVKKQFWFFSQDMRKHVTSKEQVTNGKHHPRMD